MAMFASPFFETVMGSRFLFAALNPGPLKAREVPDGLIFNQLKKMEMQSGFTPSGHPAHAFLTVAM
jgi:hypothetical protein